MKPELDDFEVLSFDCYGTLVDWETGIWDGMQPLIAASGRTDIRRMACLESFGKYESAVQTANPTMSYPNVLAEVHDAVAKDLHMASSREMSKRFGESLPYWPAFKDTADALRVLKKYFKLVMLSNVHRDGIAQTIEKLGVKFDAVYTAEDIGSYKPNPANFEYLIENVKKDLSVGDEKLLHVAQSLYHDHEPAQNAGLTSAWVDRQRISENGLWGATQRITPMPATNFTFFNLIDLANEAAG